MNLIKIESGISNIKLELPANWSEVKRRVFFRLAPMLLAYNFDVYTFRFRLLKAVSGLSKRAFIKLLPEADEDTMLHNAAAIEKVLEKLEFLQTVKFSTDLVGSIGPWPFRFSGVGNNLHLISFDQWLLAGAYASAYFNAKNKKEERQNLNKLFASLYSPWFMPWREWLMPVLGIYARLLSNSVKYAILVNFLGLKAHLIAKFPHLYKGKNDKAPNFNELITELAGAKFGNVQQVGKKEAVFILTYLNKTIREQEKTK